MPAGIQRLHATAIARPIPSRELPISRVTIPALPAAAVRINQPHPARPTHNREAPRPIARPPRAGLAAAVTGRHLQVHTGRRLPAVTAHPVPRGHPAPVTAHPVRRGHPAPVTDLPRHQDLLVP
jgi:hypothetical protein